MSNLQGAGSHSSIRSLCQSTDGTESYVCLVNLVCILDC